jgi:hypothetical protein
LPTIRTANGGSPGIAGSGGHACCGDHRQVKDLRSHAFELVKQAGLTLPGVEAATRYDGSPVLRVAGAFMAGLATHGSAEPNTLVIRADLETRESFIEDAPDTYYLTDYYRRHPVVLVRLAQVPPGVLRELLSSSHRLTLPKTDLRRRRRQSDRTQPFHFSNTGRDGAA